MIIAVTLDNTAVIKATFCCGGIVSSALLGCATCFTAHANHDKLSPVTTNHKADENGIGVFPYSGVLSPHLMYLPTMSKPYAAIKLPLQVTPRIAQKGLIIAICANFTHRHDSLTN